MEIPTGTISNIDTHSDFSWAGRVFLTFDIDWAHDEILSDCIDLVAEAGVSATWFITHDTALLGRLRSNPLWELGIHPNFNNLLFNGKEKDADANATIRRSMEIVPEAKSVRSHSLATGSMLTDAFRRAGLSHEVNMLVPGSANCMMRPWQHWTGIINVPFGWEDDVYHRYNESGSNEIEPHTHAQISRGLRVLNFHPIHVFLNTEALERYEGTRQLHREPHLLKQHRFAGYGTRTQLTELLKICARAGT